MMYINKNAYSTNILELTCVSNLLNPYYLFEFINEYNQGVTYFHCPDTSTAFCRYNQFIVCETGTTSVILSAGTINLPPGGYTYNVYEATAVTLSISATTGRVVSANNKAFVNGVETNITNEIYQ